MKWWRPHLSHGFIKFVHNKKIPTCYPPQKKKWTLNYTAGNPRDVYDVFRQNQIKVKHWTSLWWSRCHSAFQLQKVALKKHTKRRALDTGILRETLPVSCGKKEMTLQFGAFKRKLKRQHHGETCCVKVDQSCNIMVCHMLSLTYSFVKIIYDLCIYIYIHIIYLRMKNQNWLQTVSWEIISRGVFVGYD